MSRQPVTFRDLVEALMDIFGAITLIALLILCIVGVASVMWP